MSEPMKRAWWCLHCNRAFPRNEESQFDAGAVDPHFEVEPGVPGRKCPYPDCDGSPLDFWPWDDRFRKRFPDGPREGVVYDLQDVQRRDSDGE